MAELRIDAVLVFLMPCGDGFGYRAQRIEMFGRVAIAPCVIGDDTLAVFEQIDDRLVHV